jgi:hypothetical protein
MLSRVVAVYVHPTGLGVTVSLKPSKPYGWAVHTKSYWYRKALIHDHLLHHTTLQICMMSEFLPRVSATARREGRIERMAALRRVPVLLLSIPTDGLSSNPRAFLSSC